MLKMSESSVSKTLPRVGLDRKVFDVVHACISKAVKSPQGLNTSINDANTIHFQNTNSGTKNPTLNAATFPGLTLEISYL